MKNRRLFGCTPLLNEPRDYSTIYIAFTKISTIQQRRQVPELGRTCSRTILSRKIHFSAGRSLRTKNMSLRKNANASCCANSTICCSRPKPRNAASIFAASRPWSLAFQHATGPAVFRTSYPRRGLDPGSSRTTRDQRIHRHCPHQGRGR